MADLEALTTVLTAEWNEAKPDGKRDVNLGDDDIREFKTQMRERMAVDHTFPSSETGQANIGSHKAVHLIAQVSTPYSLKDAGIVYTKKVAGKAEAYFLDEDSHDVQLTSGGKILGDNVRMSNNTYLTSKDAAGTGTVNLIRASSENKSQLPDGAVMESSASPTVDAGITTKKYVDDKVAAGIARTCYKVTKSDSNFSVTNAFTTITGLSQSVTIAEKSRLLISYNVFCSTSGDAQSNYTDIIIDSTRLGGTYGLTVMPQPGLSQVGKIYSHVVSILSDELAAGTYTVAVQAKADSSGLVRASSDYKNVLSIVAVPVA